MRAPLPYVSIDFLAFKHFLLPTGLLDFVARFSTYLTRVVWMSSWVFILCISFLLWVEHCLGMGFLFLNLANVSFHPLSMGWLVLLPRHCIVPAMISFNPCLPYYFWVCGLKCLPCQFHILLLPLVSTTQHSCWASSYNIVGFLGSFSFLRHPWPILFLGPEAAPR